MTSEPFSTDAALSPTPVLKAERVLSRNQTLALIAVIASGLAYYHWRYEGWRETIQFASAVTATLIFALTFISRRLLFSLGVVAAVIAMIVVASDVKRRYIEMVLHAYDVVFYLTSPATLTFLWVDHRGYLISILASIALTLAVARTLYRYDATRIQRSVSGGLTVLCAVLAVFASYAKGERRNTQFYWDNQYLASFYSSWGETVETLMRGQLLEAMSTQPKPLFRVPVGCDVGARPPHILLIHQESVMPPELFPQLRYDTTLDPFFRSFDGKLHKLRVETYGGASWLTEFSVLAGVSTYAFGGMRTFVQSLMLGKVHDTLPQSLARCRYRNSVFYPVPKDFVGNGRFYTAVGMPEIFDFKAQNAKRFNERDAFYYANALTHIEKHVAQSKQPLFSFIITSATHLPYHKTYDADVDVPGGGPGTDPEMHEFLRRLAMARMDYDAFRADLQKRFPNERFLIVLYGDHQPIATRTLLGFETRLDAEDMKMPPDSPGFITYYAIDGLNYAPPAMPNVDTLDVPYLGAVLLNAAGLPLSEANQERLRLLDLCNGRYETCQKRDEILSFHRRLIDSGLIEAR